MSEYRHSLIEMQKNTSHHYRPPPRRFTPYWAAEIQGGEEVAKEIAKKYRFVYLGQILPGVYYFRHLRVVKRSAHMNTYYQRQLFLDPHVRWVEQQVAKVRVKRDLGVFPNDPKWKDMWYLNRGGPGGIDMNVRSVWARGFAGQGVVVTILDDGLETDHPDLSPNYDKLASLDVNGNDENPHPRYVVRDYRNTNRHGTRCAGEVAAVANNSICGMGIAYKAHIGGVRMLDGDVTDAMESRSLSHQMQYIDVYSASWGPEDDGRTVDGPGRLARLAFRDGILKGRGGLGSIFVWASGNGGKYSDNCNCDGYTNSIYTLGVSSASEHGKIPWYAETCSSTLAVTYSSGGNGERAIVTTDLNHTCTDSHSGTSASAPLAAGICALTLSANPRLTWRDLQYIVIYSARPDGLYPNDWRVNGVGRRVSHAFGYGLMDAAAMVDLALNWSTVPPQRICEVSALLPRSPLTMRHHTSERLSVDTDGCLAQANNNPAHAVFYLEHVQAKVTLTSDRRGEVELWLTSPMGTVSKLLSKRPFDLDVAGFHAWPFMSVHYWGELANGTWTLTIHSGNAVVSLHDWSLNLYGISEPPPFHPSQNSPDPRNHLHDAHPISHLLEKQQQGSQKPLTSQHPKAAPRPQQQSTDSFETLNSKDAFMDVVADRDRSQPAQSVYTAKADPFPPSYQQAGHGWNGFFPDSHDSSQWIKEDLLEEMFHANNYRAFGGAYPHSERSGMGEPKRGNTPPDPGYYPKYEGKAAAETVPHSTGQSYSNAIDAGFGLPQLAPTHRLNTPPRKSAYGQGHPAVLWQRMDLSVHSSTSSSALALATARVLTIFCICVTVSLRFPQPPLLFLWTL
uniref:P/Homo B domain-containing protein n=1 Tax=Schistocephalus solidus TaxID=70667 RepID=A0A0X3P6G6_SCHSO